MRFSSDNPSDAEVTAAVNKDMERSRKKLAKLRFFVIKTHEEGEAPHTQVVHEVVFMQDGKAKNGLLRDPFMTRYGVEVRATFAGGNRFWFRNDAVAGAIDSELMRILFDQGRLSLPTLDTNSLQLTY